MGREEHLFVKAPRGRIKIVLCTTAGCVEHHLLREGVVSKIY